MREVSYTKDSDIDREALARRNVALMLAQGARPGEVVALVGDSIPLCPRCARPKPASRRTCGRAVCVRR